MAEARRRGPAPVGPGLGSAAFRGALLIAFAVVIGAALLAKSFGGGGPLKTGTGAGPGSGGAATSKPPAASSPAPSTPVAHNPAEVKVLVLNGVDPTKTIAGPAAQALKSANYTTLNPADAKASVQTSVVYYQPGYVADAQAVAAKLGIAATAVQPLPNPLPPAVADPKDAQVIVVIGPDSTYGGATATTAN